VARRGDQRFARPAPGPRLPRCSSAPDPAGSVGSEPPERATGGTAGRCRALVPHRRAVRSVAVADGTVARPGHPAPRALRRADPGDAARRGPLGWVRGRVPGAADHGGTRTGAARLLRGGVGRGPVRARRCCRPAPLGRRQRRRPRPRSGGGGPLGGRSGAALRGLPALAAGGRRPRAVPVGGRLGRARRRCPPRVRRAQRPTAVGRRRSGRPGGGPGRVGVVPGRPGPERTDRPAADRDHRRPPGSRVTLGPDPAVGRVRRRLLGTVGRWVPFRP
jgi:hypothetical protein